MRNSQKCKKGVRRGNLGLLLRKRVIVVLILTISTLFAAYHAAFLWADEAQAVPQSSEAAPATIVESDVPSVSTQGTLLPPTKVTAQDVPYDSGGAIKITWQLSTSDIKGQGNVAYYSIQRALSLKGPFKEIGRAVAGIVQATDSQQVKDGKNYYYRVVAVKGEQRAVSEVAGPVTSSPQWLALNKWNIFLLSLIFSAFILINIFRASRGEDLYIRRIAGLNAVEEAIGRATEMGRTVLYVPGIMDMDDVQTIASMNILGQVAKKTAEYDTPLMVPTCKSVVMSTAQEVVKESYLSVGRPDAYREDSISYLTDDQFGYAAGVDGIMLRERPATNFFLGRFYAESLILAETGNFIGAIQIAGTAEASQIPFFITACDYTLIGEELFAAGAYLSREPLLLGSLKGQDWGKMMIMAVILVGVILECMDVHFLKVFFTVH